MFPNKYLIGLRSYMNQFLGARYDRNSDIIERIGHSLVTENDFKSFMALEVDLYEAGFMKAVDEYQYKLSQMGFKTEPEMKAESKTEHNS